MFLKRIALAAVAVMSLAIGQAEAANISFTGTLARANDEALFTFNVSTTSEVTLRTYSFAGGTNAAGQTIVRGGFDPNLAVFNSAGQLIAWNDDGGNNVGVDRGARYDSFLRGLLDPGTYILALATYGNQANGPTLANGFNDDGDFGLRSQFYAVDLLNVASAVRGIQTPVPEPASMALFAVGLGALVVARRRAAAR
jgi:hypothetical protein